MINPPPLDFTKVEKLRKQMLLTTGDMSTLLGISRMTYYGWVRGKPIRNSNDARVRRTLKQLLFILCEHNWPTPDVIAMSQKDRFAKLQALTTP